MESDTLAMVRGVVVMERQVLYLNSDGSIRVAFVPSDSKGNLPPYIIQYRWGRTGFFDNVAASEKINTQEVRYALLGQTRKFVVYAELP